jgi:hypothetical protein
MNRYETKSLRQRQRPARCRAVPLGVVPLLKFYLKLRWYKGNSSVFYLTRKGQENNKKLFRKNQPLIGKVKAGFKSTSAELKPGILKKMSAAFQILSRKNNFLYSKSEMLRH